MISNVGSAPSLTSLFFESRHGKTAPAAARECASGDTVSISEEARKLQEECAAAQAELATSASDSEPAVGSPETEKRPTREDLLFTLPFSLIPDDLMGGTPARNLGAFNKIYEELNSASGGKITDKELMQRAWDAFDSIPRDRAYWDGDPEVRGYVDAIHSLSAQVIAEMCESSDENTPFSQEEFTAMRDELIRRMRADGRTSGLMSEFGIKEA
jgi:hypothetical protein